jgi:hypothetical protein
LFKLYIEDGYMPYSGGFFKTVINILLGNVKFYRGQLWASPSYVKKLKGLKRKR